MATKRISRKEKYVLKVKIRMPGIANDWVELNYVASGRPDCLTLAKDVQEALEKDEPLDLRKMRIG